MRTNCIFFLALWLAFVPTAAPAGVQAKTIAVSPEALDEMFRKPGIKCVVAVMAVWCGPCKAALPAINKLYEEYGAKGMPLYGLSIDYAGAEAFDPVIAKYDVKFPIYWAGEGVIETYKLYPVPMLVFFCDGRIVDRLIGIQEEETMREAFRTFFPKICD
ncbi:MAG: TlpA family protein disulfide reductase [Deltaproteobacteria bacterium]|nr:TlpA family protein disulfide reductase [Deltaproteobacteria bacterium]